MCVCVETHIENVCVGLHSKHASIAMVTIGPGLLVSSPHLCLAAIRLILYWINIRMTPPSKPSQNQLKPG